MKLSKQMKLFLTILPLVVLLAGCVQYDANQQPTGFIYDYLVVPTQAILTEIAHFFDGNYGISIIIVSVVVRLLLMPTTFSQSKKMLMQQEKMAKVKPYLDEINTRMQQATTQEEKIAIQQEQVELYRLNGISFTGGIGCLPLLIQIPIFNALYAAIRLSEEIALSSFLGFQLGQPFIAIAVLTALVYLVQGYMSLMHLDEAQKRQMKTMMYMTPVMMIMITWTSPAGIGLYFLSGGVFAIFQTWIQNAYIRPKVKAEIDRELEEQEIILPTKSPVNTSTAKKPAQEVASKKEMFARQANKGRNSGKQNR